MENKPVKAKPGDRRKFVRFIDTHGHARDNPEDLPSPEVPIPRMKTSVITTSWWSQFSLWKPNTVFPHAIFDGPDVTRYKGALDSFTPTAHGRPTLQHGLTVKLTKNTTRKMLRTAEGAGIIAVKVYPEGVTFSEEGWSEIDEMYRAVGYAADEGLMICWHGEQPNPKGSIIDTYRREGAFMRNCFDKLVDKFPGVRFNVEHISTGETLNKVLGYPKNITGGITLHHLLLNRNDVLEYNPPGTKRTGLNPFLHCRPPVQTEEDRQLLLEVALNADRPEYQRFHLGSDSALHLGPTKLCSCGCPGVFSSPVLGPRMVQLFEDNGRLDHPAFRAFTVDNGARIYGLEVDEENTFTLEKAEYVVPGEFGGGVPLCAGETLTWSPTELAALMPEYLLD